MIEKNVYLGEILLGDRFTIQIMLWDTGFRQSLAQVAGHKIDNVQMSGKTHQNAEEDLRSSLPCQLLMVIVPLKEE